MNAGVAKKTNYSLVDKNRNRLCSKPKWEFMSNGRIKIESKDEIKKRIKRSPDKADSLANTFWPISDYDYYKERSTSNPLRGFFRLSCYAICIEMEYL
jgi:hypothetical protein